MVMAPPNMAGCPGCCSGITCRACTSLDGPEFFCCSRGFCSASRRRRASWPRSVRHRRSAPLPKVWLAIARIRVACARHSGCAGPVPLPSSAVSLRILSRLTCRLRVASRPFHRCMDGSSSRRCPRQSPRSAGYSTSNNRSRRLRSATENSYVETDHGDPRDRCGQFCGNLSGARSGLLPARLGLLRRPLLRLAANTTSTEATAWATGRWLFCWGAPDRMRSWIPCR